MIVICQGESEDCRRLAEQYELKVSVVADEDEQINQLYNIASVPTTVLIQNNRIKSYGQPNQKELDRIFNREPEIEILKEG